MIRKNQEERTSYNLFIGKSNDGEYIFLEEAFKHWDWFKWLTWNTFEFLTQWDLDKRKEDYDWLELWKEAVYHWNCTDSFEDWKEEAMEDDNCVLDDSYSQEEWLRNAMDVANQHESEDYEYSDCRGGWRMFNHEMLSERYYEYVIPANLKVLRDLFYKYEE